MCIRDRTNSNNDATLAVVVGAAGTGGTGSLAGGAGRQGTGAATDVLDGYTPMTLGDLGPSLPGWYTNAAPSGVTNVANNSNNNNTVHIGANNNADRWIRGYQQNNLERPLRLEWVQAGNGWMMWSGVNTRTNSGGTTPNGNRVEQAASKVSQGYFADNLVSTYRHYCLHRCGQ